MINESVFGNKALWLGLVLFLMGCSNFNKDRNILIVSKESGSIASQLKDMEGIRFYLTQNPISLLEDSIKKYHLVILHGDILDVINHQQQRDIERYVLAGGNLLGISPKPKYQNKWPWMEQMIAAFQDDLQKSGLVSASNVQDPGDFIWDRPYGLGSIALYAPDHTEEVLLFFQRIHHSSMEAKRLDYRDVDLPRVPPDDRYTDVTLVDQLHEPIELEILDNGDILFIERRGHLRYYEKALKQTKTLAVVDVNDSQSNGLNGLAIDPGFRENRLIYLSYTPKTDPYHQHISSYLLQEDGQSLHSEKIIMKIPIDASQGNHAVNALEFDSHGNLYIGIGDFTNEPIGYAAIDERKGHEQRDAQRTAANSNDYRGKILRIRPRPDGSYGIPQHNLFPQDGSKGRPEIYIMGCRNPYRFTIDPESNRLFWGDLGPDAGRDSMPGPKGYDEINQAAEAGFYGWPYFIADNKPYRDVDFETGEAGEFFDPSAPVNDSPNNTGLKNLPSAQPAILWYPYDHTDEFPHMGSGGMNVMAGPVYRYDAFPPSGNNLPRYYDGKLIIYDWVRNAIRAVTFDDDYQVVSVEPFLDSLNFSKPIDMKIGPDGSLYILEYGTVGYAVNKDARIRHISYAEGNRPPQARITVDKTAGANPLEVKFSARESFDYDKEDNLRFSWTLEKGIVKKGAEVTHVYENPGIYHPTLRVTDNQGAFTEAKVEVKVGNAVPEINLKVTGNQSFYWGIDTLTYEVMIEDLEDGSLKNGKIDPSEVAIEFFFQPDKNTSFTAADGISRDIKKGQALLNESGCLSCHTETTKSVGPSYAAIADRYDESEESYGTLAKVIINGGKGNWPGSFSMPAHSFLTHKDAEDIIAYVFSLQLAETPVVNLPVAGTLVTDRHSSKIQGNYFLNVSYKDKGAGPIGPIAQTASFIIRDHRVNPSACDDFSGAALRRGDNAWILEDGGYLKFNQIDLSGIQAVTYGLRSRVAGEVSLRLDAPDGPVIGSAAINPQREWNELRKSITATSGLHDLYFVFSTDHPIMEDSNYLFLVNSISFER